jgi:BASS family bile acid:Na+ symporter
MAIVWAGLLKGDVPLAVVINAGTMVLAPFLIPLLMALLAGSYVQVNILMMFYQLIYSVLFPVLGGMVLRKGYEQLGNVKKILPICPAISAIAAVFLMFMIINTSVAPILKNARVIFLLILSTILVFPIMFLVAFGIGKRFFPISKNIAITYSSGMKNLPIAIGIAVMSFKGMVALPIAVGAAFQMLTAAGFYRLFNKATRKIGGPSTESVRAINGNGRQK